MSTMDDVSRFAQELQVNKIDEMDKASLSMWIEEAQKAYEEMLRELVDNNGGHCNG